MSISFSLCLFPCIYFFYYLVISREGSCYRVSIAAVTEEGKKKKRWKFDSWIDERSFSVGRGSSARIYFVDDVACRPIRSYGNAPRNKQVGTYCGRGNMYQASHSKKPLACSAVRHYGSEHLISCQSHSVTLLVCARGRRPTPLVNGT